MITFLLYFILISNLWQWTHLNNIIVCFTQITKVMTYFQTSSPQCENFISQKKIKMICVNKMNRRVYNRDNKSFRWDPVTALFLFTIFSTHEHVIHEQFLLKIRMMRKRDAHMHRNMYQKRSLLLIHMRNQKIIWRVKVAFWDGGIFEQL